MTDTRQSPRVAVYRPSKWDDVVHLGRFFSDWIFRGVSSAAYEFIPSIERTASRYSYPLQELPIKERRLLEEFQSAAHLHFAAEILPEERDWLGWMSVIQHYGGPSRLLDFTKSFYCAAFFALERACDSAAIWAVNTLILERKAVARLGVEATGKSVNEVRHDLERKLNSSVEGQNVPRVACPYYPRRLHQRLAHQQGLFVTSGRTDVPFQRQLLETLELDAQELSSLAAAPTVEVPSSPDLDEIVKLRLVKIEIEPHLHKKGRRELKRMNLTRASLFPGPDGYAAALHWELGDLQEGEPDFVPQGVSTAAELEKKLAAPARRTQRGKPES